MLNYLNNTEKDKQESKNHLKSKWRSEVKWLSRVRLFVTPMDCSLPGSSVHGIFQARVLDWVAISFSRGSSRPRDRTWVSRIVGRRFTVWATREALKSNHLAMFANVPLKSIFPHDALCFRDFPVAQMVKNLPVMQETRVWSLGGEVPLEKGMAIHSSILVWRIPWTEKPGGLQSMGLQSQTQLSNSQTHTHTHCGLYWRTYVYPLYYTCSVLFRLPFLFS